MRARLWFLLLPVLLSARTPVERLQDAHLEALHQQRIAWMKARVVHPLPGVYQDFRAVMHIHAEDADHTKGTRVEVLAAAKKADVQVVMWTDHRGPKPDTWRGLRDGILFIAGSEDDHLLNFPSPDNPLRFLSHLEERPEMSAEGSQGMEIYNRHTDASLHPDLTEYLKNAMSHPLEWHSLVEREKQYPDEVFAAGTGSIKVMLDRWDRETATHPFTGIAANDAHQNQIYKGVTFDPYDVAFRNVSTHILARELTEKDIRDSLRAGRAYVSHDWLCDPAGFQFVAVNNFGVYDMGDPVPLLPNTRLEARLPIEARIKLIHNGVVIADTSGAEFRFVAKAEGAYRLEAWLTADGDDWPWIYSNAIYLNKTGSLTLPPSTTSDTVDVRKNIVYTEGDPADLAKHQLDLYLPKDKKTFPVMMFVHGGSWRSGDRSLYAALGNRFAKAGIGVAIPSYRLMPKNPNPAQIEDTAAAFAWVYENIAQYGGDVTRLYLAGHSAGGHLVSLLAVDDEYLKKLDVPMSAIKGVASLSGVYDVRGLAAFGSPETRADASPILHLRAGEPRFLITYCQWDYESLPMQAREFAAALKKNFDDATLIYVPGESHITEIVDTVKESDTTARALINFIQ